MGNGLNNEQISKEREREVNLRSSRLEAYRFEKLKKLLPYVKIDVPVDDWSEEAVFQRMNHFFEDSSEKYSSS